MTEAERAARQSRRFLLLYALAWAGGAVAYYPFLTILLPLRVSDLTGPADVQWLGYAAFAGAVAASFSSILFGWLSDRTGTRRAWIVAGLLGNVALLQCFALVRSPEALIALLVAWQLTLNMVLGPLGAWAGDCVPDGQKGFLGGLLALAPAAGAATGALVTIPGLAGADARLAVVGGVVFCAVVPVIIFGRPLPMPELRAPSSQRATPRKKRSAVGRMWLARLAVQISEAALFAYLLFYFRSLDAGLGDADTARIFSLMLALSVPLALLTGRWADRHDRPILQLAGAAALSSCGLAVMASSQGAGTAVAGYALFGLASAVFLALHTAQTLRVLPRPEHRGRDLGFFNLTNTIPSLVMPVLTLSLVPGFGYSALLWVLCALSAFAALLLASILRPASKA